MALSTALPGVLDKQQPWKCWPMCKDASEKTIPFWCHLGISAYLAVSSCFKEQLSLKNIQSILMNIIVYVVVQFYLWFNFHFPLFSCIVMYDNELKTKENKS